MLNSLMKSVKAQGAERGFVNLGISNPTFYLRNPQNFSLGLNWLRHLFFAPRTAAIP